MSAINRLRELEREIVHLHDAAGVLGWDQQTYMPKGAAAGRAEQLATLSTLAHQKLTSDEFRSTLEEAEKQSATLDPDSDDAALVRVTRRDFDKATKVPEELVTEESRLTALAHEVWVEARKKNDFGLFLPYLEKIVDLSLRKADHLGYEDHPYDALLDQFEPGAKTAEVKALFQSLREPLVGLLREIQATGIESSGIMTRSYPIEKQKEVTNDVVQRIGFDFETGRQDIAAHPFCTSFGNKDVRLTTRFDEHYLPGSLYASMHEAGHGMYEQGSPDEYEGTFLRGGASLGIHESQSRFWENQVGRSRAFTNYYLPRLKEFFPESLADVDEEAFYRAANEVKASLIRVEADEVTYPLHIMLRFEIETAMVERKVNLKELPELWNSKMEEYLGITPPNDTDGVLQDVHWSGGMIGYFPTYLLGTLAAAQIWNAMQSELGGLEARIEAGEFQPILGWLRERVHRYGRKYLPNELLKRATGSELDSTHMMNYLRAKYSEIYGLSVTV
ncbi:MAG: carboxypeptidase M32 [Fimbriimonadales bacterium]|nr:MAG: carboxypeptidase M32 [Fimbriimonadales bacterium]